MAPAAASPAATRLSIVPKISWDHTSPASYWTRATPNVNGPHQGGWITTPAGEDWFIHFQEVLPYGRILHVQPVAWINDWPVMGYDPDGAGKASRCSPTSCPTEPAARVCHRLRMNSISPSWACNGSGGPISRRNGPSLTARPGFLRLAPVSLDTPTVLYNRPNLLLQKFPAESFTVTTSSMCRGWARAKRRGWFWPARRCRR